MDFGFLFVKDSYLKERKLVSLDYKKSITLKVWLSKNGFKKKTQAKN